MNAKLKTVLIITAKQAVGVIIGNTSAGVFMPKTFNFHDWNGMKHYLLSSLGLILAAEGKVWLPKILNWVNSPTNGNGLTPVVVLFLASLFCPFASKAQTNVAAPPTFHFVAGGSAIGFSSGQGTQAGSVAYTGLQVTNTITATYEYLSIPSMSANGSLGVVGYTRPMSALLGKTFASKLLFNTDDINVTFSGGLGKWTTSKTNFAETVGASISYPIPGTSAAVQIIGYQYIHAPNVNGLVTRNQQVQTGLIVYF